MSAAHPPPADEPEPARSGGWTAQINALGGFIRAQRQLAKLSLREMAAMTSVSNAYLSQVERGLHQPSIKVLHSIADALQLSTEQLLNQAGWVSRTVVSHTPATQTPATQTPATQTPATQTPATQPPAADAAPGPGSTEDAIRADPRLSSEQRAALLGVYRSFVQDV